MRVSRILLINTALLLLTGCGESLPPGIMARLEPGTTAYAVTDEKEARGTIAVYVNHMPDSARFAYFRAANDDERVRLPQLRMGDRLRIIEDIDDLNARTFDLNTHTFSDDKKNVRRVEVAIETGDFRGRTGSMARRDMEVKK